MAESVASLAVIARSEHGKPVYLVHWSRSWNAWSLPGGHKNPDESHRACLVRELAEEDELHLPPPLGDPEEAAAPPIPGVDRRSVFVRVGREPLGQFRYQGFSQSRKERTDYNIALFAAELSSAALPLVTENRFLRWVSEGEIAAGQTGDHSAISDTVRLQLGMLARQFVPVVWEPEPLTRTREVMAEQLAGAENEACLGRECGYIAEQLRLLFPEARALLIREHLRGYRPHQLLVEVARATDVMAPGVYACREVHVVQVGRPEEPLIP